MFSKVPNEGQYSRHIVSWALKTSYPPRSLIGAKHLIKVSELFAEVIAANNVCINDVGSEGPTRQIEVMRNALLSLSPFAA